MDGSVKCDHEWRHIKSEGLAVTVHRRYCHLCGDTETWFDDADEGRWVRQGTETRLASAEARSDV